MDEKKGLDRYLSRLVVWAMAFGCMVGWGAFVMPGTTFLPAAGPAGTIIALSILMACFVYISMSVVSVAAVPERYASWQACLADLDHLNGLSSVPSFFAAHSVMGPAGLVVMGIAALCAMLAEMRDLFSQQMADKNIDFSIHTKRWPKSPSWL